MQHRAKFSVYANADLFTDVGIFFQFELIIVQAVWGTGQDRTGQYNNNNIHRLFEKLTNLPKHLHGPNNACVGWLVGWLSQDLRIL